MFSIPLINIGLWLFFLTCGFCIYSTLEKLAKRINRPILGIQIVIVLLIISKYVEFYALIVFHYQEVQILDIGYISLILIACMICQLICLHIQLSKFSLGLLLLTALNTGVVTYLAMVTI